MSDGKYAINKKPDITYVSQAIGKNDNIRYISKVFDLKDFKDFYYNQKERKVYEVIRESSTQEITAIYDEDTTDFSIRIQRFSKKTGAPHNQSFSFHGGALVRFLRFLESIDLLELSSKDKLRFADEYVDDLIERKKAFSQILQSSKPLPPKFLLELFNTLNQKQKTELFQKFIDNIDLYEAESLDAAIKQREYKRSLKQLEKLLHIAADDQFIEKVRCDDELKEYQANQPERERKGSHLKY